MYYFAVAPTHASHYTCEFTVSTRLVTSGLIAHHTRVNPSLHVWICHLACDLYCSLVWTPDPTSKYVRSKRMLVSLVTDFSKVCTILGEKKNSYPLIRLAKACLQVSTYCDLPRLWDKAQFLCNIRLCTRILMVIKFVTWVWRIIANKQALLTKL